jgi:serine protease AprX
MLRGSGRVQGKLLNRAFAVGISVALAAAPLVAQPARLAHADNAKISPALFAQMTANPLQRVPVIVEMNAASFPFSKPVNTSLAQAAVSILQANGQSVGGLPIIQGAAGYANAAGITAMSLLPQVASIEQDSVVRARRPASSGAPVQLASNYPQETNATQVWQQGGSGRNVTVAVLDSGVAADADLGNRLLTGVSFVGAYDSQHPDKGGHGTHIAGAIAGSGAKSNQQYVGMAPNANIVDVQVLDANGNGRYSSVLAGLGWVLSHKAAYNIKVVNLSFGAPAATASYQSDPLAAGVEAAWRDGITVVAAAGNTGPNSGTVESPGADPYVITVGSTDDKGTLSLVDDVVGWWSSWGTPTLSTARPDVVVDGRRIVSLRVPGSTLDLHLPDHVVTASNGTTYFRLTGTSMSTGVVSGAIALLLERSPNLSPDQVKLVLRSTARPFGQGALPASAGAGMIDAYAAVNSGVRGNGNPAQRQADGLARTFYPALYGVQNLVWRNVNYLGLNWLSYTWQTLPWDQAAWDNIAWDNIAWDNIAWDNIAWDNIAWDNIAWDNIAWDNAEWNNIAWDSFSFD